MATTSQHYGAESDLVALSLHSCSSSSHSAFPSQRTHVDSLPPRTLTTTQSATNLPSMLRCKRPPALQRRTQTQSHHSSPTHAACHYRSVDTNCTDNPAASHFSSTTEQRKRRRRTAEASEFHQPALSHPTTHSDAPFCSKYSKHTTLDDLVWTTFESDDDSSSCHSFSAFEYSISQHHLRSSGDDENLTACQSTPHTGSRSCWLGYDVTDFQSYGITSPNETPFSAFPQSQLLAGGDDEDMTM